MYVTKTKFCFDTQQALCYTQLKYQDLGTRKATFNQKQSTPPTHTATSFGTPPFILQLSQKSVQESISMPHTDRLLLRVLDRLLRLLQSHQVKAVHGSSKGQGCFLVVKCLPCAICHTISYVDLRNKLFCMRGLLLTHDLLLQQKYCVQFTRHIFGSLKN